MQDANFSTYFAIATRSLGLAFMVFQHIRQQFLEVKRPNSREFPWLRRNRIAVLVAFILFTVSSSLPLLFQICRASSCSNYTQLQNIATYASNISFIMIVVAIQFMKNTWKK